MSAKTDLLLAASLVLYKFSEGEEDWDEWIDLADAVEAEAAGRWGSDSVQALGRVAEFRQRLKKTQDSA
ncbi:MAG: hypothetical protein ACYS7Y_33515 [Planctomycetota bacterium]|jgi:hypothetical protein